jgi:hypothetical protein
MQFGNQHRGRGLRGLSGTATQKRQRRPGEDRPRNRCAAARYRAGRDGRHRRGGHQGDHHRRAQGHHAARHGGQARRDLWNIDGRDGVAFRASSVTPGLTAYSRPLWVRGPGLGRAVPDEGSDDHRPRPARHRAPAVRAATAGRSRNRAHGVQRGGRRPTAPTSAWRQGATARASWRRPSSQSCGARPAGPGNQHRPGALLHSRSAIASGQEEQ